MKKVRKKGFLEYIIDNVKKQDKLLLFCTIVLTVWGLFNIVTASSRESVTNLDKTLYHYFFRQLEMVLLGSAIGLAIINMPSKCYYFFSMLGYGVIFLLLSFVLATSSVRGASSWMFGGSIQPSEFAKPVLIVFLACAYERYQKRLKSKDKSVRVKYVLTFVALTFIVPVFVFLQKDAGTAIIITAIVGTLFLCSPISKIDKLRAISYASVVVLLLGTILIGTQGSILTEEQKSRLEYWFNPCQNYENGGYQVCNGYIAFNQGGLSGLGLGKSQQKYSYIPEPHTDSVFAIIAEELGAVKSALIFILYGILLYRICKIASVTKKMRGRLICIGTAVFVFVHIFINLGGLFGLLPVTGIPLPFFTYGGSFTLSLLAAIAFVQRISIENKEEKITI